MKTEKGTDFIKKFRATHNIQAEVYTKPEIKSEKVFAVGFDIRPFKLCASDKGATFSSNACFS